MSSVLPTHFDRFWTVYPKKTGKGAARKAWEKMECDAKVEVIVQSVEKHRRYAWKGKDKKFIPLPTTWLNQERWEDEVEITVEADSHNPQSSNNTLEPPPCTCPHETLLNQVLLKILTNRHGTDIDKLRECVKYKRHVAAQWRTIWPDEINISERRDQLSGVMQRLWELTGGRGSHPVSLRGG